MNQTILNMKSYDRLLAAIVLSALMLTSVFTYEMSAQNQRIKVTVSGHITDKASGETLIGAGVLTEGAGAATNNYGFYTLTIPQGKHLTLRYSYVGYDDATVTLDLLRDTTINIALKANTEIKEAVVSAQRESGIMATKMSAIEIPMNMIKNTPVLFGEADVLKTIQLMPGVQSGAEGFREYMCVEAGRMRICCSLTESLFTTPSICWDCSQSSNPRP